MEPISGQIKARGYFTGYFRLLQATSLATSRAGTMPGPISKQSRDLANVRLQLKSGKTRGSNPRPLSSEEVHALEARRDHLQTEMANGRRQRIASRVNAHTTQEAEQTREAILTELQPLTSLRWSQGVRPTAKRSASKRAAIRSLCCRLPIARTGRP